MKLKATLPILTVLALSTVTSQTTAYGLAQDDPSQAQAPAGLALETIFSPQRAPARKSMGLLQRSFLDVVETSQSNLEVALVIDGTDSMAAELAGVRLAMRSMIEDLRRYKGDSVRFQIVVYRDLGAPSGEISIPLADFTDDEQLLQQAIDGIQPESGAPYFLELVDLGVHAALTRLQWSDQPDTTRWVFLFGDAAPFDSGFEEEKTGARRRYENDVLIQTAQRIGVQVHCVLCTSRDEEQETYSRVLDKTRRFMNDISSNSGGLMLDLSYPDIRKVLFDAGKQQRVEHRRIGKITREEVESVRQRAEDIRLIVASSGRLRFAVLPHLPLNQMVFDPDRPEVQVSTQLRNQLKSVPRVEIKNPVEVERRVRRAQARGLAPDQMLPALCTLLDVDYIVWGTYETAADAITIQSSIFSRRTGQDVAQESIRSNAGFPQNELAVRLGDKLVQAASQRAGDQLLSATLASYLQAAGDQALVQTVALNDTTQTTFLAGLEALEQALAFPAGSDESKPMLDVAVERLRAVVAEDPRDGYAQRLLADALYNLAQYALKKGEPADELLSQFSRALQQAYRFRSNIRSDAIRQEVEGDYLLFVTRNYTEAIQAYETMAEYQDQATLLTTLRGHWMLAGIRSGDWGVPEDVIESEPARQHVIQILAHWPNSQEASFIKQQLRWDEDEGQNKFQHFPQSHSILAQGVPKIN